MFVRDDLLVLMASVPHSIHRVQSDVRILSGLQLGALPYFVARHATGVGNPSVLFYQRQPRCFPSYCLTSFWAPYFDTRKKMEVDVVVLDLSLL